MDHWTLIVDFFSLFIPAFIGVYGSYRLYSERLSNQESNLRSAFMAELKGTELLKKWPIDSRSVPNYNFMSVSVYEGNTGQLALLSEVETAALVHYYTQAKAVRDAIKYNTQMIVRSQTSSIGSDINSSNREDQIRKMIDKLELFRQRAMLALRESGSESGFPSQGDTLTDYHESLQQTQTLLIDYGFASCEGGDCVITESGERFFAGDLALIGREKENDILGRDESYFWRTWKGRFQSAKSILSGLVD